MYPFWETVVAPIIEAAEARRIVEIGALRGETTVLLLDALAPNSEIHVIDPLPEFDPGEHERRFPGRYVFHRDLSLNVLDDIGAFDVALVDGDHNWYTVYNELRALARTSRAAGAALPVLVLHDVCWPYVRRDLYYAPDQIPTEYRQPFAMRGMRPGRAALLPGGGMNATLHNATSEGGPRNGVMTALDDFIAEHDRPLRRVVLPFYFGLAIVVEEDRLARSPRLRARLDRLESAEGKEELLELSEHIRLEAALWEQNVLRFREGQLDRAAARYLDLLKGGLLDEQYLENELRIQYLLDCAQKQRSVNVDVVRDPARYLRKEALHLKQSRRVGGAEGAPAYFPYTNMGRDRLEHLEQALQTVRGEHVQGDIAACGVGRGGAAVFVRGFLAAYEITDRQVWVADAFRASPPDGAAPIGGTADDGTLDDLWADLNQVREAFDAFGLFDDKVRFVQGNFADTLPDAPIEQVALLHVGATAVDPVAVLEHLYDRLSFGGFVIIENDDDQVRAAVDAFRARRGITEPIERIGLSGYQWRKRTEVGAAAERPVASRPTRLDAPLAPPAPTDAVDLSVVVVFYNMRREAERTLTSLSRAYQRGIDDVSYEVVVVENGSAGDQRLGAGFVRGFGPEFRYIDMGADATPSPTPALNRGIREARGNALALMIDGAHVLTPGVLRHGLTGLASYGNAIVATQQWYVGPGQQPETVAAGYTTDDEDALFDRVEWPTDGYRLFEIGQFIGERDWLDGILESNCLFVPRSQLEQVGGFDDAFTVPGGGYANLELYERLGSSPDVTIVTILGEGSFHQVHGGTTTNNAARDDRRSETVSYADEYRERRGRQLRGPVKTIHYVGAMSIQSAWRTRARRMAAESFGGTRITTGPDGLPAKPQLLPQELRTTFIEAYWNSLAWQHSSWLGAPLPKAPTDLFVYQELLASIRPDWVIVTGNGAPGRTLFLASVCECLEQGTVVSVGPESSDRPVHPRITYVDGAPHDEATAERVREVTAGGAKAFVVLGSRTDVARTTKEFDRYAPLVGTGSFVVVEDTLVNGHPVWAGYGPGPYEALARILARHPEFVQDNGVDRHGLTFNAGGFLRRVSS
jgi:cephalosporin hydroxylase